ncbi:MAG: FAD binding domain-containing protein [Sedimentibacter sp.]
MFTIEKYVLADSLEQAYELNQNKRNVIIGGMLWLKMGRKKIGTAIDLSSLGLNLIEEDEDSFKIGCMCTLRDVETNNSLNHHFNDMFSKSLEHIVGVQMRNMATIGGSIYSRFGFSDILTALLSLDCYVELFKGGVVPLEKYVDMPRDNDILVKIIIKKDGRKVNYSSHRKSSADLPVLTCAVSNLGSMWNIVIGASPSKAKLSQFNLGENPNEKQVDSMISQVIGSTCFGTNLRGSKKYRQLLADVLVRRNIEMIIKGGKYAN